MRAVALTAGALVMGAGAACTPGHTSAPAADVAVTHVTVVDVVGGGLLDDQTVLIDGTRISWVGPADGVRIPAGAQIVDGRDRFLIPGLADMHVHFGLGVPMPRRPDEAEAVLARLLYHGVTSVLALGGTDLSTEMINAFRERQEEGELPGPWLYGAGGHLTLPGAHPVATIFPAEVREAAAALLASVPPEEPANLYDLGIGISLVRTEEAARTSVRERASGGMDAIKITVESGPGPFGTDHPRMPPNMIRAVVDEAARHGLPVFAHASSPDELADILDAGAAGVLHAIGDPPLPDAEVGRRMVEDRFYYVPTLALYRNFVGYWNDPALFDDPFLRATVTDEEIRSFDAPEFMARHRSTFEYFDGPLESGGPRRIDALSENVGSLHRLGVPMVVGTDTGNPFTFPGHSVHQELEFLVEAGLSPLEALVAGTLQAARMLGKEGEFGSVEVGKRADLVLLDANPLDDIRGTRSIGVVIANGQVLDRAALEALVGR